MERIEPIVPAHVGDWLEGDTTYHALGHAEADDLADLVLIHPVLDCGGEIDGDLVLREIGDSPLFDVAQVFATKRFIGGGPETVELQIDLEVALELCQAPHELPV